MDDMQAYFERRRFVQFKTVLDDMRKQDVIGGLRQLGDDLQKENGLSIAQCEFWSDTLDRWAEDLVDPACSGTCPRLQIEAAACRRRSCWKCCRSSKAKSTSAKRPASPSRPSRRSKQRSIAKQAERLSKTQDELRDRIDKVDRAHSRAARRRGGVRQGDRPAGRGRRGDGRSDGHPGAARDRLAGDRRRDGSDRAAAAVEADQPQGRRRRRLEPRRRRRRRRRPTRPWPCSAAASTRRKSAKTAASRRPPATGGASCRKSSAPAWTSTSTGSKAGAKSERSHAHALPLDRTRAGWGPSGVGIVVLADDGDVQSWNDGQSPDPAALIDTREDRGRSRGAAQRN